MGQRSQTFIRVLNPVYYLLQESENSAKVKRQLAGWIKALGVDEYTILAYHHQWLYGLTFANIMCKILAFYKADVEKYDTHPLHVGNLIRYAKGNTPKSQVEFFVNFHTMLLSINNDPWENTRGAAFEHFYFLNEIEPEMRTAFDRGDNNDGVCIIDAIQGKYAFIAIGNGCGEVMVPKYKPMTAEQYVSAYYPLVDKDRYEGYKPLTKEEIIENKIRVVMASKAFTPYELLTPDELNKMFPEISTPVSI